MGLFHIRWQTLKTLLDGFLFANRFSGIEKIQQTTLLETLSDGILAVDLQGSPLFYNSQFAIIFGTRKFQSRKIWKTFHSAEVLSAYQAALKEGKQTSVQAAVFDQPTGRQFFSVSISPLRQKKGEIYGALGIFHDVTDLKRAEQIRIDFVANVSHELRTPLTVIKGYADTLLLDMKDGKTPEIQLVEVIVRHSDRLMDLINNLLDLSSLESTDILHKAELNTEEVSQNVLQQFKGLFEQRDQKVALSTEVKSLRADPHRLEQVLINLLDNASKYTPRGGQIWIEWLPSRSGGVSLSITDTGPGIPTEHHHRLFERFYRVDKARCRDSGGSGLGLAIVKHIMQRHGGSVWIESKLEKGASFFCHFPG